MTKVQSYKDLTVWQKSMDLVSGCYKIAEQLPKHEIYALASQLTRASVSIPSNIAEVYRRNHRNEYLQFCSIAAGSAAEVETQLLITGRNYPIDVKEALFLVTEVQKKLYVLIKKLQSTP